MYRCQDCGFKGNKTTHLGGCAACESLNVKQQGKAKAQKVTKEKEKKNMAEILVLVLVWGALAYGVWERYIK